MGSQHLPPSLLNQSAHKKICRIKKIPPTVCILIEHFPSTRTRFDSKTRRQMMSVRCDDERSVGLGSWSMTAAAVCHAHPDHSLSPEVELIPSFDGLHGTDWSGCQRATPQSRRFFGWNIVERKVIFLETKILNAFLDTLFSNRGNNDNNLRMVMDRSLAWISSSQLTFFL